MEIEEALSYIEFIFTKYEEELIYQRWIAGPQYQISFEEFKEKLKPVPLKPDKEIIDDVFEIIELFGKES